MALCGHQPYGGIAAAAASSMARQQRAGGITPYLRIRRMKHNARISDARIAAQAARWQP